MRFINFFGGWVPRVRRCIVLLPCKAKNIFLYSFSYSDVLLCHSSAEASESPRSSDLFLYDECVPRCCQWFFFIPLQFLSLSLLFCDYCQKRWLYDLTFGKTIEISGSLCSMVTTWIIGGLMLITQTFFPLSATGGLLAEAVWRLVGERKKMFIHQDNHQISSLSFPYKRERSELIL